MAQNKFLGDLLAGAPVYRADVTERFSVRAPIERNDDVQGGCSDGTYYYQVFMHRENETGQENNEVRVAKIDPASGEIVKLSRNLWLHHANDMTYNKKTNKLLVCNNAPHRNWLSVLDPDSLELERTIELSVEIFGISYNEARDAYVVGLSYGKSFCQLDADFRVIENSRCEPSPLTLHFVNQGICSDDEYVYFAFWDAKTLRENPEKFQSAIAVYRWGGTYVGQIYFDIGEREPENLSYHQGKFWMVAGDEGSMRCYEFS